MARTETLRLLTEERIVIPEDMAFGDLKLQVFDRDAVRFNYNVLRQAWVATGHHSDLLVGAGTAEISAFIVRLFSACVRAGEFVDVETAGVVGLLRDETVPGRRLVPS